MKFLRKFSFLAVALFAVGSAQAVPVDLELALVIDESGSIDPTEWQLQVSGYEAAFNDAGVQTAIQALGDAGTGGIAVGVYIFGSSVRAAVGWTQLASAADAAAFATVLGNLTQVGGATNIYAGLTAALDGIQNNSFEGNRLTIDVSGDGQQNVAVNGCNSTASCAVQVGNARDAAAAAGITVNGLAIQSTAIETYYQTYVQTSDGFTSFAATFADIAAAATDKIRREIEETTVSEPGTLALFGLGLLSLGFARRRQRA